MTNTTHPADALGIAAQGDSPLDRLLALAKERVRVELVPLRFRSGHRKMVTRVIVGARQVTFTERAPKRLAIPQALNLLAAGYSE